MSSPQVKSKKSSQDAIFKVLRQIAYTKLFKKYSSGNYSFNKISINNLVFNDNCLVVARFKDFLIYDDNTDFLRRFYPTKDRIQRLNKILTFYEKYSKIFPNYLVLKENKYLYRNIRKKQKMIDAFNEIKREEKENRKKLKNNQNNIKNDVNELFTKKIKNEIKSYQNNISFKNYYKNSFDSDKNNDDTLMINQNSISIYYKQFNDENKEAIYMESFIGNQTNGSISNIVNVLNENKIYTKDLPNIFMQNSSNNDKKYKKNYNSGIDIKNNINKKAQTKKDKSHNSIKAINNISNKDENDNLSSKNIKNESQVKKKKLSDKNNLYKYAFTSNNATNSSSVISKKNKNQNILSPINKKNKDSNDNKTNQSNNIYDTNNDRKNIITKISSKNSHKNLNQKTTPNLGFKKHYFKTNNNFKKNMLSKNIEKNNKDINIKESTRKNKDDNDKNKNIINKETVKKKYVKCKHISQDFDTNQIYKMTENILNNKNTIPSKENSKNIINTENTCFKSYKNFLTNDNPNLITGDTKSNERNEKNFMEDKVLVNVRDIINQEKEKDNKKLFYTAKKSKIEKDTILTKTKPNTNAGKSLKFYKTKKNYLNSIDNNYNKKNIDLLNENENNNKVRNNSEFTKQKTEYKYVNKRLMTKEQRTKTKQIFVKNKNADKKKLLIKSSENFDKTKKIFNKNKESHTKEKNIETNNTLRSNKLYEIKYESTLIPSNYKNHNNSERRMAVNLSDINMKKHKNIFSSDKKETKKFKTKNHIIKNSDKLNLNKSAKLPSDGRTKKYKSFLIKNKKKFNNEYNYNSQKDILSINILNRIQAVKQNQEQYDFYRTLKVKNSKRSININNSNNSLSKTKYNKNHKTIKTPVINNKKANFFKNHISKRLNKISSNRTKEEMINNHTSSLSIKVNKTTYNKDKDKEKNVKNKNLKKTWTKNIQKKDNPISNNIHSEVMQ